MTDLRQLITANAGCGKTWTLANQCIGWMIDRKRRTGDADPAGLVAATFTRNAAGEILHRVLEHLAVSALDQDALSMFVDGFNVDPEPTPEEMNEVLADVAKSLHRLQFGTLDGLFHRMAQTFAGEIGMPVGWSIGDEPTLNSIRTRSLDDLLEQAPSEVIRTLVIEAEQEILKAQVHGRLIPLVFGERSSPGLISIWRQSHLVSGDDRMWSLLDSLDDAVLAPGSSRLSEEDIDRAIHTLEEASLALNKDGTANANWINARRRIVEIARARSWLDFLKDKMTNALALDRPFSRHTAPDDFLIAIDPLIGHARMKIVDAIRSQMRSWRILLRGIDVCARLRSREAGFYGFQDVADQLSAARLLETTDRDWLNYRLDSEIRDIALDEFQDTSDAQFNVMEPIIREILSGEGGHDLPRRMLVVADPKQSIYGWRGGTPSLLGKLSTLVEGGFHESTLDRSYRSGPAVINFVNDVFTDLGDNPAFSRARHHSIPSNTLEICGLPESRTSGTPVSRALSDWRFDHHETAHPDMPGAILAYRIDPAARVPSGGRLNETIRNEVLVEKIVEIVKDRFDVSGSIGVLLPRNKQVAATVEALRAAGIEASEEGAGSLSDSRIVVCLMALLRLAEHPDHRESAYDVSHSPLGGIVNLPPIEQIEPEQRDRLLSNISLEIRRDILSLGIDGYLQKLVNRLENHMDSKDRKAIEYVIDLAAAWNPTDSLVLGDFVRHVESSTAGEPSGASVRVMTMHASKGLEFDEVILPVLNEAMVEENSDGGCLTWSPSPREPMALVVPRMSSDLRHHVPLLELVSQREWERSLGDRLSLLYVSITRARRVLNLIFQVESTSNRKILSSGAVVRCSIPELSAAFDEYEEDEHGRFWTRMEAGWTDMTRVERKTIEPIGEPRPIRVSENGGSEPARAPSVTDRSSRESFRIIETSARRRGTLLHELFRTIIWLDDGKPSDKDLSSTFIRTSMMTGRPFSSSERKEAVQIMSDAIEDGIIAHRLSRSAYDSLGCDDLEVLNEWPILSTVEGSLVRGRIDRLVIGRSSGVVRFVEIIDYKSGRIHDDASEREAIERYAPQIERYAEIVRDQFRLENPEVSVTGRLLFIESGRDVPCLQCQTDH